MPKRIRVRRNGLDTPMDIARYKYYEKYHDEYPGRRRDTIHKCVDCIHYDEGVYDDGEYFWTCGDEHEFDIDPEYEACPYYEN